MFESLESRQLFSTTLATPTTGPAPEPSTTPVIEADADADAEARRKRSYNSIMITKTVDRSSAALFM